MTTELCLRALYLNTFIFIIDKGEDQLTAAKVYGDIVVPGLGERREGLMEGQREGYEALLVPPATGGHESLMVEMKRLGIGFSPSTPEGGRIPEWSVADCPGTGRRWT